MNVSIIILNWNGLNYVTQCLTSIKDNIPKYCEVIVVDNGSIDGSVEYLESLDWIKLIKLPENVGFTKGNNIAIESTDSDVILLNNDTIITQNDCVEKLQQTAYGADNIGVVGCRMVDQHNSLQHAGSYIRHETCWGQQIGGHQNDINQHNIDAEVEGVIFACAYIKRELIEKIGPQDEDYFAYFDDTDYCFKAKEAGYKTICCGGVTITHIQNVSTKLNNVSFNEMFSKSQEIFKSKWYNKLENRFIDSVTWHSVCGFPTGYAISCKNMMLALDKKDIDVRYKYVYGENTVFPVKEKTLSDNYIINVIKRREFDESLPQIVYGQGNVFYKNTGSYKIGFTMLEVTGLPDEWIEGCNAMDEVWVPSTFNAQTFRDSGVTKPIYVIPLGVDPAYFNPNIKPDKFIKTDKFTFLSIFQWGKRKNPIKLIESFIEEFKKEDNVRLLCKIDSAGIDIIDELSKLNLPSDRASVDIIYNENWPAWKLGSLYTAADCFVSATRGEGFGMPMLEAMACGLPTLATDWSAHTDFMTEEYSYPIKVEKMISARAKCPYYEGFEWAEVDKEHLKHLMRYVYENQKDAKDKGMAASEMVLTDWTWDKSAEKIINRLQEIKDLAGLQQFEGITL